MATGLRSPAGNGRSGNLAGFFIWTLVILAVTLFPYDPGFGPALSESLSRFNLHPLGNPGDFLANVILFLPWGFAAAFLLSRPRHTGSKILVVAALGLGLSGLVELFQLGLISRNPALADILANLLGVYGGAKLAAARGESVRAGLAAAGNIMKTVLTPARLFLLLAIHLGLVYGLFRYADHQASLANWDAGYHLNLGNEKTGNRPWLGYLGEVRLWSTVLDQGDIDGLLGGVGYPAGKDQELLWAFDPAGRGDPDTKGACDLDLVWFPARPADASGDMTCLSVDHWLTSQDPAAALSDALRQAGTFTLYVKAQTGDTGQGGPGRIVSLSADPYHRNFTLGQDGVDLVFRLRTPLTGLNGEEPALIVSDVFVGEKAKAWVITFDGAGLAFHQTAGKPPVRLVFRYGAVFRGLGFGFNLADQAGYRSVVWGFVIIPLVVFSAAISAGLRARSRKPGV